MLDELEGRLEVVEEAVDVGEEDGDVAPRGQQLGDLYGRDRIGSVWLPRGRGALVIATVRTVSPRELPPPIAVFEVQGFGAHPSRSWGFGPRRRSSR